MKNAIKIFTVVALFVFAAPFLRDNQIKAQSIFDDAESSANSIEKRAGIVIGVSQSAELNVCVIMDEENGMVFSYEYSGAVEFQVNDKVSYTVETCGKDKVIIRNITR